MDRLISIGKASKLLDVTLQTLRVWDSDGKLKAVRTEGGHRRYLLSDIQGIQGIEQDSSDGNGAVIAYCRVSSNDQKEKGVLERQMDHVLSYCSFKGYYVSHALEEVGSGMSDTRPKLKTLFDLVSSGKVDRVVIEHKDRLTRFMFNVFESFFDSHGVEIECVGDELSKTYEDELSKTYEEELVEDMLTLMSSFSSKIKNLRKV